MLSYFTDVLATLRRDPAIGPFADTAGEATSRLDRRLSHLNADLDELEAVTIRPADCSIWSGNYWNRDKLDAASCADLISSIATEGGNTEPVIIRRNAGESPIPYELLTGHRRRFAVDWLNHNGRPEMRLNALVVDLSDEDAFRLSDAENKGREDICELDRAYSYKMAAERFYGGVQSKMAEALAISNSHLSRLLSLAEMPEEVIAAFGRREDIRVRHSEILSPLLRKEDARRKIIREAVRIDLEQKELSAQDDRLLPPSTALSRLKKAAAEGTRDEPENCWPVVFNGGRIGSVDLSDEEIRVDVSLPANSDTEAAIKAIGLALDQAMQGEK